MESRLARLSLWTSDEEIKLLGYFKMPESINAWKKVSPHFYICQLCQSGIGIPASGSARYTDGHGLVRHCQTMVLLHVAPAC
jgi:hypothetical protein